MNRSFPLLGVLLLSALTAWAGELTFRGTTDKDAALYQPGEEMKFSVQLLDDSAPVAGKHLKWKRTGDDGKVESGEAVSSASEPLKISTSLAQPGFVRIEVSVLDENGKVVENVVNGKGAPVMFNGGAGVDIEKLESVPEPADFDAFWAKQKARLAEVPLKFTLVEIPSKNPDFVLYDVKVDCAGGKQVSGYFTKPVNAAPKSLRAQLGFQGYGVASATANYQRGAMCLVINAHGIENGKEPSFYDDLKAGELKGYGFKNDENQTPESCYFNGMLLRVMRALQFMKAQPEWNGKDLRVEGGSQGGFQALSAAALDPDVTECFANIPWLCDLGGITLGRLRGWRPDFEPGMAYFDSVNMARRIRCKTEINAGLGDYTCPPSGVSVLYNHIKAPKRLVFFQGKTHSYTPKDTQKITEQADWP